MREQPVPAVGRIKLFTMRSICTLSTGLLLYVIILDSTELLFDRQLIWINSPHPMIKRKTVATVLSSPRFRFSGVIGPILFLKSTYELRINAITCKSFSPVFSKLCPCPSFTTHTSPELTTASTPSSLYMPCPSRMKYTSLSP